MDKKKAYKIVYEDLMTNKPSLFSGKFDARNTDKRVIFRNKKNAVYSSYKFMHGIQTVMGAIAYCAGKDEEFDTLWDKNFEESLERAKIMKKGK